MALNLKSEIMKLLQKMEDIQDIGIGKDFFRKDPQNSDNKSKNRQIGLH